MTADQKSPVDDEMISSADALTKTLYSTVMDLFGDDEKIMQKQKCYGSSCSSTKTTDSTSIITKKLLEGYVLHRDSCDKCVVPLMVYEGRVSCVVCKWEEEQEALKAKSASSDGTEEEVTRNDTLPTFTTATTTGSALSEEEEEDLINKELSQFNERRSQATQAYTAKILAGSTMQDQLCSKCDMPMMKCEDVVGCIFCDIEVACCETQESVQGEAKEEVHGSGTYDENNPVPIKEMDLSNEIINGTLPATEQKPAKELSQAELIVERLKGMQSKGHGENVDSELDKAEIELMKIIGNQTGGEVGEIFQDYFTKKKQYRAQLIASKNTNEDAQAQAEDNRIIGNDVIMGDVILELRALASMSFEEAEAEMCDVITEQHTGEVEVEVSSRQHADTRPRNIYVKQPVSSVMVVGLDDDGCSKPIVATPIDGIKDGFVNVNDFVSPIAPARWLD